MLKIIIAIIIVIILFIIFMSIFIPKMNGGINTLYNIPDDLNDEDMKHSKLKRKIDDFTNAYNACDSDIYRVHCQVPKYEYICDDPEYKSMVPIVQNIVSFITFKIQRRFSDSFEKYIAFSLIEAFLVLKYEYGLDLIEIANSSKEIVHKRRVRYTNVKLIGMGSFNAIISINDYILRLMTMDLDNFEKYTTLQNLKIMYSTSAIHNLPHIYYSSYNIIPDTFDEYTSKLEYMPIWHLEEKYNEITIKNIENINEFMNKYLDCIINILSNAFKNGLNYADWKLENIMKDNENNIVLTDFDFIDLSSRLLCSYNYFQLYKYVMEYVKDKYSSIISQVEIRNLRPTSFGLNSEAEVEIGDMTFEEKTEIFVNKQLSAVIALYDIIYIYSCYTCHELYTMNRQREHFCLELDKIEFIDEFIDRIIHSGINDLNHDEIKMFLDKLRIYHLRDDDD